MIAIVQSFFSPFVRMWQLDNLAAHCLDRQIISLT